MDQPVNLLIEVALEHIDNVKALLQKDIKKPDAIMEYACRGNNVELITLLLEDDSINHCFENKGLLAAAERIDRYGDDVLEILFKHKNIKQSLHKDIFKDIKNNTTLNSLLNKHLMTKKIVNF
jgi:hypothetical protein